MWQKAKASSKAPASAPAAKRYVRRRKKKKQWSFSVIELQYIRLYVGKLCRCRRFAVFTRSRHDSLHTHSRIMTSSLSRRTARSTRHDMVED